MSCDWPSRAIPVCLPCVLPIGGPDVMAPRGRAGHLLVAALVLSLAASVAWADGWSGRVVHVRAGDGLLVDPGNGAVAVRLAHVRSPGRDHFFWERARRALGELAFDRRVVVIPLQPGGEGIRGRVLVNGDDVAAQLVERGLLLTDARAPDHLRALEQRARRQGRGMWGSGIPPRGR